MKKKFYKFLPALVFNINPDKLKIQQYHILIYYNNLEFRQSCPLPSKKLRMLILNLRFF